MTLDEDAAKVAQPYFTGKLPKGDPLVEDIAAFGRRCAEQMREECAKAIRDHIANAQKGMRTSHMDLVVMGLDRAYEAIRRVEVK